MPRDQWAACLLPIARMIWQTRIMTPERYISRNPAAFSVADEAFATILPFGEAVLSIFRNSPSLLDRPYRLRALQFNQSYNFSIDVSAAENEIIIALYRCGVKIDSIKADTPSSIWHDVIFPSPPNDSINATAWRALNVRSHAVVDLALYYTHLANIYVPNAGLIRNLYSTNVEVDALGRTNEGHAEEAVTRILRKYGPSEGDARQHARHILMMMKHDVSAKPRAPASRGIPFERECLQALASAEFDVRATPASGDFGADLIATKDDLGFAIQCKDTSKPVGVKAVQEAVAARSHYRVDFAVVCSTSRFTDAAVELATSNKVILSNLANLVRQLEAA
jgi:hypothetical protein